MDKIKINCICFPCGLEIYSEYLEITLKDIKNINCPLHGRKCYNRRQMEDVTNK